MRWSLSLLLAVPVACWSPGTSDKVPAHTGEEETGSEDTCAPTCDDDTGSESAEDSTAETGVDTGSDSSGDSTDSSADDSAGSDSAGDDLDLNDADAKLLGDAPGIGAGFAVSDVGDANGDGLGDLAVIAPAGSPGIVFVMQHPVSGSVSLGDSEGRLIADGTDEIGMTTEMAPMDGGADMDGDGYDDLVVGMPFSGADSEGWAGVLEGPVVGDLYPTDVDATLSGGALDIAGSGVAWLGDMNGDGWEDLAIGANGVVGSESEVGYCSRADEEVEDDEYGLAAGAVYVVLGPVTGTASLEEGSEARLVGEDGYDYAGEPVVPAGDLNGDGIVDLFGAASGNCEGGYEAGAAYVVLGPVSGEGLLADADAKLVGEFYHDRAGQSLAVAGDTNGDGWPDLLVGVPRRDVFRGETYLILGPVSGTVDLSTADAMFTGEAAVDYSGASVVGAGDQDADGYADLAIGAYFADSETEYGGALYILYGPQAGLHDLGEADAKFTAPSGAAGKSVANVGDVDLDGLPDLLVGAYSDSDGASGAGAAYLLLGGGTLLTHARESR